MISSMTGYGKGLVETGEFVIEAEVKSLNNRFLDIAYRIPKSLTNKEFELRELVKRRFKRGKIFLTINLSKNNMEKDTPYNLTAIQNTLSILKKIKKAGNIKGRITLSELFAFQNSNFADTFLDVDKEWEYIEKAVSSAINELEQMRLKEGEELYKDLIERINVVKNTLSSIEGYANTSIKEYFGKLKNRAKELLDDFPNFNDRLEMELALLAEKYDITEECVRLKSHIKMFLDTMNNSEEVGRKLNFICQEMNREINTINSKSVSIQISQLGILIKEELEKIREQIQNIE